MLISARVTRWAMSHLAGERPQTHRGEQQRHTPGGSLMTTLATWCRRCGIEFVADRPSVLAGTWRLCPDCREAPSPPGPPVPRPTAGGKV